MKFLQEAAIMGQFRHPNVVKLFGVIADEEPVRSVTFAGKPVGSEKEKTYFRTSDKDLKPGKPKNQSLSTSF